MPRASAAANLMPDADGVVRRMPMALRLGAGLVPGMAAEVLRVADGASDITMISNEHDPLSFVTGIGLAALETKAGRVPTDASGRIRLHYAADVSQRILSLDALPTEPLKDAIVLVGAQGQVVKTPLGPASIANVMAEGRGRPSDRPGADRGPTGSGPPKPCCCCCWARA